MDAGGGQGGFPGGYTGLPSANTASMSSGSNINTNSVVSVGAAAPLFAPQQVTNVAAAGDMDGSAEPTAKRLKVEPSMDSAVANMAAIAASRAGVGSGMSTEQFLQALPAAYSAQQQQPAFMVMLQQQQQQMQQQQQAQAQRQQMLQQHHQQQQQLQQQQQQLQHHIQAQKQLQLQRHLQVAGSQFPMGMQQQQQQQQQQFAVPQAMTSAHAQSQAQAQTIMMAAMAQNRLAQLQQQQQQQQQQRQLQIQAMFKTESRPMAAASVAHPSLLVAQQKKPQPVEDPVCLVCKAKGDDLFVCTYGCGLAAHPRCIGENMIISPLIGGKICASCSIMQQDRNTNENLQKGGMSAMSVRRAILCLNVETNAPTNFEKFGHLASLRLFEIAQVAGYPIGPFASRFIEPHLQRWIAEKLVHIASWPMNVRDVFTLMIGLYSLDRAAVCHGWRNKAIELVRAKNFSTTDFLGWHPAIEGPDVRCSSLCGICCIRNPPEMAHCARCRRPLMFPTVFTKFVSALLASHYAEHVGISFGISFLDVFAHTHSVRAHYKGLKPIDPNGFEWDMFADQMRMIFGLLDIVSNFGVLELDPDLFDAEASIIFNQQYLNHAMLLLEFETAGRFLQCMKLFGRQRAEQYRPVIENCEKFLIARQQPNGSWCKANSTVVDQYKATVVCAKALLNPVIRGRGPANLEQRRLLIKWAKKTPGNLHAKRAEQLGQGKILAAGVTVTGRTVPNLKKLELFYRRQIVPTSGLNSLETLAKARLRAIWSLQKPETQEEDVKDEMVSATTDNEDTDVLSVKAEQSEDAVAEEDESLIKLSLSGELSLFDGLKFEDGDVIDISANGAADEEEEEEKGDDLKAEDDEESAENENGGAEEDQDEADDMYDDDDDADADGMSQLPEPDMANQVDEATDAANEIDVGEEVDMSALDSELQLDGSFSQSSMDLALDM